MRWLSLLLLLTVPPLCGAAVYKWVDHEGRTHYSDKFVEGAEPVPVTVAPDASETTANGPSSSGQRPSPPPDTGPYKSFQIVSPEENQTFRDPGGAVAVRLLIEPAMPPDQRLLLVLDGQPVPGNVQGTQLALKGLPLGSHRLRADLLDAQGNTVASTPPVDFHVGASLQGPAPQ
jgi:hypothetical protein